MREIPLTGLGGGFVAVVDDDDFEWVDSLNPEVTEDYLYNLQAACSRQVTASKHLGLVCSAVGVYEGNKAKEIEKAAVQAALIPVPEGRYEFTGKVLSVKVYDGYTYDAPPVVKYLVLVEAAEGNFKVFGTLPGTDANQGDTVTLKATVTRSDTDEFFGFYKRPFGIKVVTP